MQQQRSISLDILKIILSFFVVVGHLQPLFSGDVIEGWLISNGICRVLVPCFFMISGFFIFSKIDDMKAVGKYLGQLIVIYLVWSFFYLYFYYEGTPFYTIAGRFLFGYFHLWYLPALFSGLIFLIIARKLIKNDAFIIAIILLIYLIGHVLDPNRSMAFHYRNGFFIGFPFIAFGYYIRKYNIKDLLTTKQLIFIMIISFLTLMLETYLYFYDGKKFSDMYLSALILCPATILLCLKHPLKVNSSIVTEYFSDLPSGIYYFHLFFVFKMYSVNYNIYNAPVIFLTAALATIPLIFINRRLPIRLFL